MAITIVLWLARSSTPIPVRSIECKTVAVLAERMTSFDDRSKRELKRTARKIWWDGSVEDRMTAEIGSRL